MVVTANELAFTIPDYYTIKFCHDFTKQEILIKDLQDSSKYPNRFNLFHIDISVFNEFDNGFYTYSVYDSDSNLLERGKMKLTGFQDNSPSHYNNPTEFSTYGS